MAKLINEEYMRKTFNIHKDVVNERITPYITVALRRLKIWVGGTTFATTDEDLKEILEIAAGTLAMHFMVRNLNTAIRPKGLVATETVEGNVTVRYLNPMETTQTEISYFAQAEELVRGLLETDVQEDGFDFVADDLEPTHITQEWLT